jgi:phosphate transport system substrate-binding protein
MALRFKGDSHVNKAFILAASAVVAPVFLALAIAAPAAARDRIQIVGSSTVFPFTAAVAESFAKTGGFKAPVVESTGTGGGFKLFCAGVGEGNPDITGASRAIKASEFEDCAKNGVTEIIEIKVGYDGIVLANAKSGPDFALTKAQLWSALAKQVPVDGKMVDNPYKNWSDIDASLPNEAIVVYGPPPTSGTRDAFVELVMDKGCETSPVVKALDKDPMKAACQSVREDGAYIEAGENDTLIVQKLEADPEAAGIFGYSFLDQNADKIKGASIEGKVPTYDDIADGSYKVSRPLFIYVKKAHIGVVPGIPEFLAEYTSQRAWGPEGYLADKGLIAMPDAERRSFAEAATSLSAMAAPQ